MNRRQFLATAAGAGWTALTGGGPRRAYSRDSGRDIGGVVHVEGKPLAGVLVSDGRQVTRTDSSGRFRLRVHPLTSGPFVFVTTPRGYWTDDFFVPSTTAHKTGVVNFALQPVEQPDRFAFIFMADMHLEKREVGIPKFRATLAEIQQLEPRPAFLWAQGDICLEGHVGPDYARCLAALKIPVRNGAGNHEMMLSHRNPRDDFHRLFGPTYYSFDWGPIHAIVLDGNKPIPRQTGWKAVHGAVEGAELEWLKADLAAQPPGKPIVVGVHIPIVSTYPERRRHSPDDAPYWEVTNHRELTDLLARHGVRLVLQGHMHENERAVVGGVEYVASISVSGSWWNSGPGMERGVDGVPRGYRIVSVDGTRISHRYCPSCESFVDRPGEWYGLEEPLARSERTELVLNAYDAPNGSQAAARIDDGPWLPMVPAQIFSKTTPDLVMPHHFRLLADTTGLAAGPHRIAARVRWPDGTVIETEQPFSVVDGR